VPLELFFPVRLVCMTPVPALVSFPESSVVSLVPAMLEPPLALKAQSSIVELKLNCLVKVAIA